MRVLLVEAGSRHAPDLSAVPPAWPMLFGTDADWADTTEPQGANGISLPFPHGRVLGGSSSINAMFFVRGHHTSYDDWARTGARGWGFQDLLPYFRRSENVPGRDPSLRGTDGPLTPGPAEPLHPIMEAGLAAAAEVGHPLATDVSGGAEEGFGRADLNIVNGRRQSAADAYLLPALDRPNLTILTDTLVHRVIVRNGRAMGVEYRAGNDVVIASSAGEVVLSSGTIGSAQLLLLSGIGPKSHLTEMGIEPVRELPGVGLNLHDHSLSQVTYRPTQPLPPMEHNHSGVIGLLRSRSGLEGPDLQFLFSDIPLYGPALPGPDGLYSVVFSAMLPRSRGTLRLRSGDPADRPRIDPRYYTDDHDVDVMVAGLRLAREMGRANAFKDWRGEEVFPGPGREQRRGNPQLHPAQLADLLPPGRYLPHRRRRHRGRGHATARSPDRRSSRGRCVGHALGSFGQHQRHGLCHRGTRGGSAAGESLLTRSRCGVTASS
ncbi:GMC family oxidoreductase N-terminal domain-containing protein [Amycolatopsis sp. DSM 110486]|nr:GMC family oxidoreductase N-terminal domain-containing protein [Amycolatopsis sp. DSM 110486]QYN20418.1 GMC family oxidoreductase N-terminal domain-containing protein [Amycolatopsis sp. DSM 110486]